MTLPAHGEDGRRLDRVGTANDRLKAGRQLMLHRSILASVLLHVAVIVGWPELTLPALATGEIAGSAQLQLVSLGSVVAPGPARPAAPTWIEDAADEADDESADGGADGDLGRAGGGDTAPDGWEGVDADLWRLAAVAPRFVDPVTPVEDDDGDDDATDAEVSSEGDTAEGLVIRRGSAELEYQRLSDEEMLSLERLSSLRPELVLVSPSSWLVLRNPREVGAFMRERFEDAGIDGLTSGSLSVSLWVDERGSVEWAEINRSSGHDPIDASAIELFRDVVAFRPAREEGMRVPVAAIFWLMW
jgi:TonB family protein